jgi:sodium/hydrogen antiporter
MAWEHLSINRPHLVYLILGGFTSIFMLCSLFIKEKLYIGEATVATICGIIFGPHAANLINPLEWGNPDQVTLEFSRIVLVVQCFAVGVELPKSYMERHWKSVVFLLLPVMTYGWLVTSLFIWWMVEPLTWLESLICAACVTATDPVLASSVVGKGKFAKRVPKHLRDILSAESGCNDGMAFPFIYLSVYIARYRPDANKVALHWFCYTILYECIFGAFFGFMVGYIARHAIKLAERKGLIDRESFLVFYFVLALFCAGSGSLLGMDDLLIGFSAGVGFSNDGWFTEKTEESHVSNVIDLLLNLSYFVYFGTVIPWDQFHAPELGMVPWRLVVIGIFVIFFRRIPIMLALKPILPDVKTWREALFAGHFGPIGVGAIFAAILARAELETESTDPLAVLPPPGSRDHHVIYLIWPITCFLVIISIAIHGSSIAVFTLGKRINTLTLTLSYTQDNEVGRSWMDRLPRMTSSNSKSLSRLDTTSLESESNEKLAFPPGTLGPTGVPGNFLRRQKDDTEKPGTTTVGRSRRKGKWEPGKGPGGPISQSAIEPQRRSESALKISAESGSDTLNEKSADVSPESRLPSLVGRLSGSSSTSPERADLDRKGRSADIEAYEEGDEMIVEDEEGNVLSVFDTRGQSAESKAERIEKERKKLSHEETGEHAKYKHKPHDKMEGEDIEKVAGEVAGHPHKNLKKQLGNWRGWGRPKEEEEVGASLRTKAKAPERKRGPAHAYQFGNTIIVEDEDGEVIKTYSLPPNEKNRKSSGDTQPQGWRKMSNTADMRRGLGRVGTWVGMSGEKTHVPPVVDTAASSATIEGQSSSAAQLKGNVDHHEESNDLFGDNSLRFTISHIDRHGHGLSGASGTSHANGITTGSGRRYSAVDFLKEIQQMDPKAQIQAIDDSNAPDHVKTEMRRAAREDGDLNYTSPQQGGQQRTDSIPSVAATRPGSVSRSTSDVIISSPLSRTARPVNRRVVTEGVGPGNALHSNSAADQRRHPAPVIGMTTASTLEEEDEEEQRQEVPTHDVGSTLARFRKEGGTAADIRRHQLSTIASRGSGEGAAADFAGIDRGWQGDGEEDEEAETAAEKRRRLAALAVSQDREGSESEEDEERLPRRKTDRITTSAEEEGEDELIRQARQRETMVPDLEPPEPEFKPRVQWGGVSGKETTAAKKDATEGEARQSKVEGVSSGRDGDRRGIKALFGKRH